MTENFQLGHFPESPQDIPQDFAIVLYSVSIRSTNRREWLNKRYGRRKKKGWIKASVAFDLGSGKVLEMKVTDNKSHDSECSVGLI